MPRRLAPIAGDTLPKIAQYNGQSVVGNGVGTVVYYNYLSGQTASIGTSNFYTAPADGIYLVSSSVFVTTAGSAGTVAGNIQAHNGTINVSFGTGNINLTGQNSGQVTTTTFVGAGQVIKGGATVTGATGSPVYSAIWSIVRLV